MEEGEPQDADCLLPHSDIAIVAIDSRLMRAAQEKAERAPSSYWSFGGGPIATNASVLAAGLTAAVRME